MSKFWSARTREIEPYVPGEQPKDKKYIKLNTNENPYPPSLKVREAIKLSAEEGLNLYPDPSARDLRETTAKYYGLKPDQVFVGNGSDEVLAFSFMAFFDKERKILFPDISYSFYIVYAQLLDLNYELVPLSEELDIISKDYCKDNGGIIIANPNAPTSKCLSLVSIEKIIKENKNSVVIIDEAYVEFGGESCIKLVNKYPNLLVVQTFSKSRSLAGLRVGFAFGHKDLIEGLNRIKDSINSYTLDRLALAGANMAFSDEDYFKETVTKIINTRENSIIELRELGFKVFDSKANFVFVSHDKFSAEYLFKELRKSGVLVRYFNKPRINNYLRISIGTDEEMNILITNLKEIISGK